MRYFSISMSDFSIFMGILSGVVTVIAAAGAGYFRYKSCKKRRELQKQQDEKQRQKDELEPAARSVPPPDRSRKRSFFTP